VKTRLLFELDKLIAKWGQKYPLAVNPWKNHWNHVSTFFKYPEHIRKLIYTTNALEGLHRQLRKVTKNRTLFPNDEALTKNIVFGDSGYYEKMDDATSKLGFDNFTVGCYVSRQIRFGNNMKFPFTQINLQSPEGSTR